MWLARADAAGTAWEAETLIFSYVGVPALECDIAFDENTNVVVCMNRATGVGGTQEMWVYFYDSLIGGYNFLNLGEGRSVKAILDEPLDSVNGDVLLFYMKDSTNQLCFRVQRERYLITNVVLLGTGTQVVAANSYVDDAYRTTDGRLAVLVAINEPISGTYKYLHYETSLYPQILPAGQITIGVALQSRNAELRQIIINQVNETETFKVLVPAVQSGSLVDVVILVPGTLYDLPLDKWQVFVPAIQSGAIPQIVIEVPGTLYGEVREDMKVFVGLQSGMIPQVVIEHTTRDIEQLIARVNLQSGTLV